MRAAGPPFGVASQPIAASFFGSDYVFQLGFQMGGGGNHQRLCTKHPVIPATHLPPRSNECINHRA